jgi:lipopolysaccharide/colanic/teichoic acid biosynthesis glycosyltransferase/2-keto-3-deoxy-L-rhamnonate aldolase RhmA
MFYLTIKRVLDFLLSLIGLILLSPLFIILIIIIKIDSKGPILFKQKRIGRNKKTFNILKFRTMRIDTPRDTPTHLLQDADQWITKFGKFLRKSSLDELPQIINILKGDMSIVGPRPALWNQYDLIEERDKYNVHKLYPGLTGYAQIHGRDEVSIEEKARLDGYYAQHVNFFLDVKVFFQTFGSVLNSRGVVEGKKTIKLVANIQDRPNLELMYITNNPMVAEVAESSGVDMIFIDLETLGKAKRQGHIDSVKSNHSLLDIKNVKKVLKKSKLLVRVNPMHKDSKHEIDTAINNGADLIMLPMFKTKKEVRKFIKLVDGRAKVFLLLETKEAMRDIEKITSLKGIDRIHVGLNDLHLSLKKIFMFELLIDGTVEKITKTLNERGIPFGIGGIARVGLGLVPSEYIIAEHYRIGSRFAILSRSFCDAHKAEDFNNLRPIFKEGILNIRNVEQQIRNYTEDDFIKNHSILIKKINDVVEMKEVKK